MQRVNKTVLAALAWCLVGQAAHAAPIAEVDFQTGGVTFSGLGGGGYIGIELHSDNGLLLAENAEDFGHLTDRSMAPHRLAWSYFSGFGSEPIFAGNVIDVSGQSPDTGPDFLSSDLFWTAHPGIGNTRFGEIRIVNVPEPTAGTLLFLAMTGAVALHGRRGRQ